MKTGYRLGAISLFCLSLVLSGCATKQDLLRVEEKVNQIRNDQAILNSRMERVDSILVTGAQQDNRLRIEMQTALNELNTQLAQLQNQLSDMQQLVFRSSQRSSGGNIQSLQPTAAADSAKPVPADSSGGHTVSTVDCRQVWDDAFKDMRRGQHELAISGFSDYLKFCPNGELRDNSQYWIAEAHYEMKQYEKAIEEYDRLLEQYPETEKKPTAYFKIGRSHEELKNRKKAQEYFQRLKTEFPNSVEYQQAKEKLEKWQKEGKR